MEHYRAVIGCFCISKDIKRAAAHSVAGCIAACLCMPSVIGSIHCKAVSLTDQTVIGISYVGCRQLTTTVVVILGIQSLELHTGLDLYRDGGEVTCNFPAVRYITCCLKIGVGCTGIAVDAACVIVHAPQRGIPKSIIIIRLNGRIKHVVKTRIIERNSIPSGCCRNRFPCGPCAIGCRTAIRRTSAGCQ